MNETTMTAELNEMIDRLEANFAAEQKGTKPRNAHKETIKQPSHTHRLFAFKLCARRTFKKSRNSHLKRSFFALTALAKLAARKNPKLILTELYGTFRPKE